jgi:hypothetical protein
MLQASPGRRVSGFSQADRRSGPEGLDVHIIIDNYATHKTAAIKIWLARRPHCHMHFTPTSASWTSEPAPTKVGVERWFAELTRKQLRRRVHASAQQFEDDIRGFIDRHNESPGLANGPNPQTKSSPP